MKILKLAVKEQYFNKIKQGIKTEEYRLVKKYWGKRLLKEYDEVHITLGYPRKDEKDKILKFKWGGYEIKTIQHNEFGANPVKVYAIKLENRIKTIIKIYQLCMYKNNKFKFVTSDDPDCDGCYFENNCHKISKGALPECLALYRSSKKNIIFKKINSDKYRRY